MWAYFGFYESAEGELTEPMLKVTTGQICSVIYVTTTRNFRASALTETFSPMFDVETS